MTTTFPLSLPGQRLEPLKHYRCHGRSRPDKLLINIRLISSMYVLIVFSRLPFLVLHRVWTLKAQVTAYA